MVITMLSGKGDGLQIGTFKIRPIAEGAISAIFVLLSNVIYPLVRDVVGNQTESESENNINKQKDV